MNQRVRATAHTMPPIDTIDALQSKASATQASFFSDLAANLTPLSQQSIDMALAKATVEVIAGAQALDMQAADLEAQIQLLVESISGSHISQALRDYVNQA